MTQKQQETPDFPVYVNIKKKHIDHILEMGNRKGSIEIDVETSTFPAPFQYKLSLVLNWTFMEKRIPSGRHNTEEVEVPITRTETILNGSVPLARGMDDPRVQEMEAQFYQAAEFLKLIAQSTSNEDTDDKLTHDDLMEQLESLDLETPEKITV